HEVEVGQRGLGDAPQPLQFVVRGEIVRGAALVAGGDDGAGDRQQRVRLRRQQRCRHQVAFGEPGAVVEQARGGEKRREIDLHRGAAGGGEALDGGSERRGGCVITEKGQLRG